MKRSGSSWRCRGFSTEEPFRGREPLLRKDTTAGVPADGVEMPASFAALIKRIGEQTGLRGKKLYLPIRAALTGRLHGPELDRIFALLGPTSLRKRVETALALT